MDFIMLWQWFYILYFLGLYLCYLMLNILSFWGVSQYMQERWMTTLPRLYSGFEIPISILVPAYNEETTIETSIRSLLQLSYPEYEILVINDGSRDKTLEVLINKFSLVPFPEAYRICLPVKPIRAVYRSTKYPNLRVIDKENGGKADALNAGINIARYPLFCCIDADSFLQRDSLQRVVRPFLDDPTTVAAGGTVRLANGCKVKDGFLVEVGLPSNLLALIQIVEYLRAFLFGRLGWSLLNSLLVISGAFSLFHKETVIAVGGYRTDTVGEDMELVVRIHRFLRLRGKPYRITFVPDPICWTDGPENLQDLKSQRMRWHQGLSESLTMNMGLLFNSKAGILGWMAFPFMLFFEMIGPLVEIAGYIFFTTALILGLISYQAMISFMLLVIGCNLLISITALFLEEISFPVYSKAKYLLLMFLAVMAENFGYRQLICIWRIKGLWRWLLGKSGWSEIKRTAHWQQNT